MAILKALLLARAEGWVSVTIFSDSRSALSAVRSRFNPRSSSYLVLRVKSVLLDMERAGTLTRLVWIPSHVGIRGNERADALAKDAIPHGVDSQLGVPLREIKNYWKKDMFTELFDWCSREAAVRGFFYCHKYLTRFCHPWFAFFNIRRRTVTTFNRLCSGHSSLRAHLFRFRIVDSPLCPACGVEESPNHMFWVCPEFDKEHQLLVRGLVKARGFLPHPVEYLMATLRKDILPPVEEFITSIPKFI
ncbi:uncharacterized protein LOC109863035 [Pseudomyrmex gracilis]|uniref:uncharacterized protein LOC109863035 n=1 Tax=Pseudomyrmex gracilis TaxID=219809 RepID=UPI000995623B|nr:uncharacterized protein LOC109863035 [Pseudomyrmex gracilis]